MTMRLVPAVDIRGGRCVNLVQGDYGQETVFSEDPVGQARLWWRGLLDAGADPACAFVHIVDLDGAKAGECRVLNELRDMAADGIQFEVGGGIRTLEAAESVIGAGAARVILGTAAHRDPALLREACRCWPGKVVAGIDARDGRVSLCGWLEDTGTDAVDFARQTADAGVSRIIYTDILSDGMMNGPNHGTTRMVARAAGVPVTLSGGVSSLEDLKRARELEPDGVDEVIVGRALYLNRFSIAAAAAVFQESP